MDANEERDRLRNHKAKWDALAHENDRYYVRSVEHKQSDEEYEESGKQNVRDFISNDDVLAKNLAPFSEKTILEIGCGSGRITKTLARTFKYVVALDISAVMLEKAEKFVNADNVIYVESTGENVPVLPESVDLAFSYIVYQHFPSYHAVEMSFRGVWRALRHGGVFKTQVRGLRHPDPGHWSWGPHYDSQEMTELLDRTQFRLLSSSGQKSRAYWLVLQKE